MNSEVGLEISFLSEKNGGEILDLMNDIDISFEQEEGTIHIKNNNWLLTYDYKAKNSSDSKNGYEIITSVYDKDEVRKYILSYISEKAEKGNFEFNKKCELHLNISRSGLEGILDTDEKKLLFVYNFEKSIELHGLLEGNDHYEKNKNSTYVFRSLVHETKFMQPYEILDLANLSPRDLIRKVISTANSFYSSISYALSAWKDNRNVVCFKKINYDILEIKLSADYFFNDNNLSEIEKIVDIVENILDRISKTPEVKIVKELYPYVVNDLVKAVDTIVVYNDKKDELEYKHVR